MSLINNKPEINDDEIRIIKPEGKTDFKDNPEKSKNLNLPEYTLVHSYLAPEMKRRLPQRRRWWKRPWLLVSVILFICAVSVFFWWEISKDIKSLTSYDLEPEVYDEEVYYKVKPNSASSIINSDGYVQINDTLVSGNPLSIYRPLNMTPRLMLGPQTLKDTTAGFVLQAADVRADNGGIVGAYVYQGKLLSRGNSKAGFCAIINGKIILGVADSTPYLEQAIDSEGYFFRQYPLVVGGQMVENNLQTSSLRKALAQLNGETIVVMTKGKMTLNQFARILIDMGVSEAIYLVGSTSYGFARTKEGSLQYFGERVEDPATNVNYIVWN